MIPPSGGLVDRRVARPRKQPIGVISIEETEELALRCRDEDRLHAFLVHPIDEAAQFLPPLDRRRPEPHEVRDEHVVVGRQILSPNAPEDDVVLVHDDAEGIRAQPFADVAGRRLGRARERHGLEHLTRHVSERSVALHRKTLLAPLRLAAGKIEDAGEAQRLEPPRGPRAEVSEVVVAVHDHRAVAVHVPDRVLRELLQRDALGAGDVFFFVLVARKDLEKGRTFLAKEPLCFVGTDVCWHGCEGSPFGCDGPSTLSASRQARARPWQTARVDDDDLLRRAEAALTEIKVNQGLSEEHAAVLAALRIRLTGAADRSLEEMLAASEDRPDDLSAKMAETERAPKPSLDDLLSQPESKPEWPG